MVSSDLFTVSTQEGHTKVVYGHAEDVYKQHIHVHAWQGWGTSEPITQNITTENKVLLVSECSNELHVSHEKEANFGLSIQEQYPKQHP